MSKNNVPLEKIQIQTISTCNSNCVFCPYVESWHKATPGKMELSLYQKILTEAEEYDDTLDTLCPYLQNEPLTDNRIFDWIEMFYDKFPDKSVEMSINPGLLTPKNVKKIIKTFKDKKHILPISFHGMNQTSFEYIMKIPFKSSLKNVLNLIKKADGEVNIQIRGAGMSRDNKILYFHEGHYMQFWIDQLNDAGLKMEHANVQYFTFHDRIGQIARTERDAHKNNYGIVRKIDDDNPFDCVRLDKVLHVLYNGDIATCCMDYKKEVDENKPG